MYLSQCIVAIFHAGHFFRIVLAVLVSQSFDSLNKPHNNDDKAAFSGLLDLMYSYKLSDVTKSYDIQYQSEEYFVV